MPLVRHLLLTVMVVSVSAISSAGPVKLTGPAWCAADRCWRKKSTCETFVEVSRKAGESVEACKPQSEVACFTYTNYVTEIRKRIPVESCTLQLSSCETVRKKARKASTVKDVTVCKVYRYE
jgi:hypothetical protein